MKNITKPPCNNKNSGLILEAPNEKDHIVGGVTVGGLTITKPEAQLIFPNGHGWHGVQAKGEGEVQANANFDSFSCTDYARMKALCKYLKYVYNEDIDPLEAFAAVMAGTIPGRGNTVRNGMESTRKDGWLTEMECPSRVLTDKTTQAAFFAPFTTKQIETAKKKLEKYNIYWDLIDGSSNVSHAKIIEALKYSPVVVIGYAWASYYGNEGVYYSYDYQPNHCFLIDDYKENDPLIDLMANDSYRFNWSGTKPDHTDLEDFVKPLSKKYEIGGAWRIYATLKTSKKKLLFNLSKNMLKAYFDHIGLHLYYVDDRGKQHIPLNDEFEKAVAISWFNSGSIGKTSWGELQPMPDYKFF